MAITAWFVEGCYIYIYIATCICDDWGIGKSTVVIWTCWWPHFAWFQYIDTPWMAESNVSEANIPASTSDFVLRMLFFNVSKRFFGLIVSPSTETKTNSTHDHPWLYLQLSSVFFHMFFSERNTLDFPIGSMYAIYVNIYHQYTPDVSIYIPYMDPMGLSTIIIHRFTIINHYKPLLSIDSLGYHHGSVMGFGLRRLSCGRLHQTLRRSRRVRLSQGGSGSRYRVIHKWVN